MIRVQDFNAKKRSSIDLFFCLKQMECDGDGDGDGDGNGDGYAVGVSGVVL